MHDLLFIDISTHKFSNQCVFLVHLLPRQPTSDQSEHGGLVLYIQLTK